MIDPNDFDPSDYHTHNSDTLYDIAAEAHHNATAKGFWEDNIGIPRYLTIALKMALLHSEVSEWLEAERKPGPSEHIPDFTAAEEEAADILIRWGDTVKGTMDFHRVVAAVYAKMAYNRDRPYMHGKTC